MLELQTNLREDDAKLYNQRASINSVLNMKALVLGAFNQENALVGAFSVIVKTVCETDGSFVAI